MKKLVKIIPLIMVIAGMYLAGRSMMYYAKGAATRAFIFKAWEDTKETKEDTSPWGWADFHPVTNMKIPDIHLDCFVMDKISDEAMAYGSGHLSTSPLPGEPGNVVIAGHRDAEFRKLKDIEMGMVINLETKSDTFYYKVTEIDTAKGSDIFWMDKTKRDCVTLITCYPFDYVGKAEKRFIVRGELAL